MEPGFWRYFVEAAAGMNEQERTVPRHSIRRSRRSPAPPQSLPGQPRPRRSRARASCRSSLSSGRSDGSRCKGAYGGVISEARFGRSDRFQFPLSTGHFWSGWLRDRFRGAFAPRRVPGRSSRPQNMVPGTYRTKPGAKDCYWSRTNDGGDIIANYIIGFARPTGSPSPSTPPKASITSAAACGQRSTDPYPRQPGYEQEPPASAS